MKAVAAVTIVLSALLVCPAISSAYVYWANFNADTIGRANADGTAANPNFIPASRPEAVAVDGQFIYWANEEANSVGRANLDGTNVNDDFIAGVAGGQVLGVAVDSQHVYWVNFDNNSIGRANLDGTGVDENFITGAMGPWGVAVDSHFIYWSNTGNGTIGRANLDGSGVTQGLVSGTTMGTALAVNSQFIYWANAGGTTIGRANLDGGSPSQNFITGLSQPQGVAVDAGHIYWSNFAGTHAIGRANLDGSGIEQSFIGSANSPLGLTVDFPPASTTVPSITGATVAGQTLSTVDGAWTLFPTSFVHQWLRCDTAGAGCTAIGGATGQTYGLTSADVGSTVRVQEAAANPFGGSGSPALSSQTGIVQPAPPGPPTASLAATSTSGPTATLTLTCSGTAGQQCTGHAVGTAHERTRGATILAVAARKGSKHGGKPKTKTVALTVARASYAVPAGTTARVRVTLNSIGMRLVTRFANLPVTVAITGSITATRRLVFTLPRVGVNTPPDDWFDIIAPCNGPCYSSPRTVPITGIPRGAKVVVSCRGKGCPFASRRVSPQNQKIDLARVLGTHTQLAPGTVVDVTITARDHIGEVLHYAIRPGIPPMRLTLCLPPGGTRTTVCT